MAAFVGRRLRFAVLISAEELASAPMDMKRDFNSELMMTEGYKGICSIDRATLFIFDGRADISGVVKKARKIGFTSVGPVQEPVFLEDSQIQRPEYKRYRYNRYRRR